MSRIEPSHLGFPPLTPVLNLLVTDGIARMEDIVAIGGHTHTQDSFDQYYSHHSNNPTSHRRRAATK